MPAGEELYCEMCGARIAGRPYHALVDGVEMTLCASCYLKLVRSGRARPLERKPSPRRARVEARPRPRRGLELYDIVEDFDERIVRAREAKGWTRAALAQRLRISEAMLRKIEQGKLKPSVDLARRIEKLLGITLLVPVETEEFEEDYDLPPGRVTLGDVVIVKKDED